MFCEDRDFLTLGNYFSNLLLTLYRERNTHPFKTEKKNYFSVAKVNKPTSRVQGQKTKLQLKPAIVMANYLQEKRQQNHSLVPAKMEFSELLPPEKSQLLP